MLQIETCEYVSIVKRAGQEGWLDGLTAAHAAPCNRDEAFKILGLLRNLPKMKVLFRAGNRGRARFSRRTKRYGMTLSAEAGGKSGRLRAGLVLHEAAHILAHLDLKKFDHQEQYCRTLRRLLQTDWRKQLMPTSSFATIYARHRGPFSLSLVRELDHGGKRGKEQISDRLAGPFTSEEAHEEARMLVGDPRENVSSAFVFSETEGQFCGAAYHRGETYRPWAEELAALIGDDAPIELSPADSAAFAEAVIHPAPPTEALKEAAAKPALSRERRKKEAQPAPTEGAKIAARVLANRVPRKASLALQVAPGSEAKWPPAASAQAILAAFKARGAMTAKEAAEALAPRLVELGVAHPASAVSRLKQAGLLQEVAA